MTIIEFVDAMMDHGKVQVFIMVDMNLDVMMDVIVKVVHLVDIKIIMLKKEIYHQLVYELVLVFVTHQRSIIFCV